ncbi:putative TIR domain-containing protein [Helianthus debilis subsp. tardiflorus]
MVVLTEISEESSSSSLTYNYDVFLSFRGEDTRNNFTDHLLKALKEATIDTFFDDEEIQIGEFLKPELENAIKASRSSIIVLSKDYASSTWCLDELAFIMEQKRTSKHIVFPIFYHVNPSDVRKQRNSFGDAMADHKQRMERESDEKKRSQLGKKIEKWKKALTEVAHMKGEEAKGRRSLLKKLLKI